MTTRLAVRLLALGTLLVGLTARADAQTRGITEGDYVARDFRFASGETMPSLRLHYRTMGRVRRDAGGTVRNAVLVLHGTGGDGAQFLTPQFAPEMYGAGQPFDTTRFYVILPDDIGHGRSSKPSDGMHMRFPRYDYADMVRAEYALVTDGLHVNHLRAILGTSMGCMHAWMWGEAYATFVDGLVPLACAPTQIAGRNRMFRTLVIDAIRMDPTWQNGEYTTPPAGLRGALEVVWMMGTAPMLQHVQAPTRDAADSVVRAWIGDRLRTTDANDLLYQYESSRDYDPSASLATITTPVLAMNSEDDQVNPPALGIMERLMPNVAHARFVLIPAGPLTRGHSTHTWAAVWKPTSPPSSPRCRSDDAQRFGRDDAALGRLAEPAAKTVRHRRRRRCVRDRARRIGLAAVHALLDEGKRVIGVDAGTVGGGAAGRNGGFLLAGLYDFYHDAVAQFGRERARRLYRLTLDELARIAAESPDAVRLRGSLRIATSDLEDDDCRAQLDAMRADSLPVASYDGPEGRGLLVPTDGAMQPLRRVRELAERAVARGAALYERTRAHEIAGDVVRTDDGVIRCRAVVVAIDGALDRVLPELAPRVRTARLQMLATAPTTVTYTRPVYARWGFDYWQQRDDGAIAIGGARDVGGESEWTHDACITAPVQAAIERVLRDQLHIDAPIVRRWAASVGYSSNGLPVFAEARPGVWACGGYSGTGNVLGALCGAAAARHAIGVPNTIDRELVALLAG